MTWENIYAQLNYGMENTAQIINNQRLIIQSVLDDIPGTEEEAQRLQESMILSKQLAGVSASPGSEANSIMNKFLTELAEAMSLDITESLNVSASSRDKAIKPITEEQFNKLKEIRNKYGFKDNNKSIPRYKYNELLQKLIKARNNAIDDPSNSKVTEMLSQIIDALMEYNPDIPRSDGGGSIWKTYKTGKSLRFEDQPQAAAELSELMNLGEAIVSLGGLSQDIGKIGEQFGAMAALVYYEQEEKITDEMIKQLIQTGQVQGKNARVRITGDDKSRKGYYAQVKSNFTKNASRGPKGKNEEYFYQLGKTDDKVDLTVTLQGGKEQINFSVKNYADTSTVTILSGNIFPILDMYNMFLEHYIALLMSSSTPSDSLHSMYQMMKSTVGIHALIGGVRAIDDAGGIITTPTAHYFMVNNNSRTDANSLRVYSTKAVGQKILNHADLIELLGGSEPIINKPYNPDVSYDDRFSGIDVELKLSQLKNSI